MAKNKLIVVDMQNDFIDGSLGTSEAVTIVANVVSKIKYYQGKYGIDSVIFTMDTHGENYLKTCEGKYLPVPHCIKPEYGWKLNKEIQKYVFAESRVVEKNTFGAKNIHTFLNKNDSVELVGLCTGICVISNAILIKTWYPEMQITVDASCCACVTPESHKRTLEAMKLLQINIINE